MPRTVQLHETREDEGRRKERMAYSRSAMLALQCAITGTLQGCAQNSAPHMAEAFSFSFAFLSAWTLLLAIYSWYLLGTMGQVVYVPPRPQPSTMTMNLFQGTQVREEEFDLRRTAHVDSEAGHWTSPPSRSIWEHRSTDDVFSIGGMLGAMLCRSSKSYAGDA